MTKFTEWLDFEMKARGVTDRADLVRRAKSKGYQLSNQVLSNIYAGRRKPGKNVLSGIAAGLGAKVVDVYREAGLIDDEKPLTGFQKRILDLIGDNLKKEEQETLYEIVRAYIKGIKKLS
jgi:hypothetical protein